MGCLLIVLLVLLNLKKKHLRNHGVKNYQKTNYRGYVDQYTEARRELVGRHSIDYIDVNVWYLSDYLFVVVDVLYYYCEQTSKGELIRTLCWFVDLPSRVLDPGRLIYVAAYTKSFCDIVELNLEYQHE